MGSADEAPRRRQPLLVWVILALYAVGLALVAFWPTHVDAGMHPLLDAITRLFPAATYARIEFAANVALFVPLGVLLMLVLRRRYLVVPIALVTTVAIESGQSLMLGARTASVRDVIANLAGACVGMLLVAAVEALRARSSRRR